MPVYRTLLASGSPRRRELLKLLNIPFEVCTPDVDEDPLPGESPDAMVARLSRVKAEAGRSENVGSLVIAADTTVEMGGQIYGKPTNPSDARRMLRELRGREHHVHGGITFCSRGVEQTLATCTCVWMRDYGDDEIDAYVDTGDPMDKAAAYAVQHPIFRPVERMEGCFANVMGLALCRLYQALAALYSLPEPQIDCVHHPERDCSVRMLVHQGVIPGS